MGKFGTSTATVATETRSTPTRAPSPVADVWTPFAASVVSAALVMATVLSAAFFLPQLERWPWGWAAPVGLAILTGMWGFERWTARTSLLALEKRDNRDYNGDGVIGTGAPPHPVSVNEGTDTRADKETAAWVVELKTFVDACLRYGTGIRNLKGRGAKDETDWAQKRDTLMGIGVAGWKNPDNRKDGWSITVSRKRAHDIIDGKIWLTTGR